MGPYLEKYKQNIAIEMRRRGLSYSEIENRVHIPKSTLSYWLKKIKLTPEQVKKLNDKRTETARKNAVKKTLRVSKAIEEIKNSSAQDVKEISKKELWLMGLVLYWKNGNQSDLKKGVHFSSSDPAMLKLFLKWLKEVGGIQDKEIKFDIFIKENKKKKGFNKNSKAVQENIVYWAKITGFPKEYFSSVYCQPRPFLKERGQKGNKKKESNCGFLRVKVSQSSMLARQIAGWIDGIKYVNNLN